MVVVLAVVPAGARAAGGAHLTGGLLAGAGLTGAGLAGGYLAGRGLARTLAGGAALGLIGVVAAVELVPDAGHQRVIGLHRLVGIHLRILAVPDLPGDDDEPGIGELIAAGGESQQPVPGLDIHAGINQRPHLDILHILHKGLLGAVEEVQVVEDRAVLLPGVGDEHPEHLVLAGLVDGVEFQHRVLPVEVQVPVLEQQLEHGAGAHIVAVDDGVLGGAQVGAVVHKGGAALVLLAVKATMEVVVVVGVLHHRVGKVGAVDGQIADHILVLGVEVLKLREIVPGHTVRVGGALLLRRGTLLRGALLGGGEALAALPGGGLLPIPAEQQPAGQNARQRQHRQRCGELHREAAIRRQRGLRFRLCRGFRLGEGPFGGLRRPVEQPPVRRQQPQLLPAAVAQHIVLRLQRQFLGIHRIVEALRVGAGSGEGEGLQRAPAEGRQEGVAVPHQQRQEVLRVTGQAEDRLLPALHAETGEPLRREHLGDVRYGGQLLRGEIRLRVGRTPGPGAGQGAGVYALLQAEAVAQQPAQSVRALQVADGNQHGAAVQGVGQGVVAVLSGGIRREGGDLHPGDGGQLPAQRGGQRGLSVQEEASGQVEQYRFHGITSLCRHTGAGLSYHTPLKSGLCFPGKGVQSSG